MLKYESFVSRSLFRSRLGLSLMSIESSSNNTTVAFESNESNMLPLYESLNFLYSNEKAALSKVSFDTKLFTCAG